MPTCSICLEGLDACRDVCVRTVCGHDYHGACLSRWFLVRHDCPTCRHVLSRSECRVVYMGWTGTRGDVCTDLPLRLNGVEFRMSDPKDVVLCILFVFFLQHQLILPLSNLSPGTLSTLDEIVYEIVHHHVPMSSMTTVALDFPSFYGRKTLNVRLDDNATPTVLVLRVDDFRSMFTRPPSTFVLPPPSLHAPHGKDGGDLDKRIRNERW